MMKRPRISSQASRCLIHGVRDGLGEVGLQFRRGHGDAVEEQPQVQAVLVMQGVTQLPHHTQAVGGIARREFRVHPEGRLELGEGDGLLRPQQRDPVAQHVQGAAGVDLVAHPGEQGIRRRGAVAFLQGRPGLGLARLHPGDEVGGIERQRAVVVLMVLGAAVEPVVGGQVVADVVLEGDFVVGAHAASGSTRPRTSILPVTAAEISAVRRS